MTRYAEPDDGWLEPGWDQDIARRCVTVLSAAIDRDAESVARDIAYVGETYGHRGVYSMCNAFGEAIKRLGFDDGVAILESDDLLGQFFLVPTFLDIRAAIPMTCPRARSGGICSPPASWWRT